MLAEKKVDLYSILFILIFFIFVTMLWNLIVRDVLCFIYCISWPQLHHRFNSTNRVLYCLFCTIHERDFYNVRLLCLTKASKNL